MKDVVLVTQTLGMGGAEVFNSQLLSWLQRHDYRVQAFTTNAKFATLLTNHDIPTNKIPIIIDIIGDWKGLVKGLALFPIAIFYYATLAWQLRQKTIFTTGFIEKILLTPWANLFGARVVWIEFGPLSSVTNKFWGFPGVLYKLVSNLPPLVIMSSRHTQKANAIFSYKKVQVIPCAVDVKLYKTKTNPYLVVCVSRLDNGKGQNLLVEAWLKVIKKIPHAKLRIIGEGGEYNNLKLQISKLKLNSSITLAGWVEDAVLEMSKSAIVVFPSVWPLEGFGIAAAEAMAQAKPVVGFDRGPLPELVDSQSGILVPEGNTIQLADAIVDLLQHPQKAKQKGEKAKLRYQKLFTWESVGPQYEVVLG